jgi:hypothetical protein
MPCRAKSLRIEFGAQDAQPAHPGPNTRKPTMSPNLARTAAVIFAFLASSFCAGASAQSLRCKGDLAQIGNSKGTILQKCGEPVLKDSFCKPTQNTTSTTTPTAPTNTAGNSASTTTNVTVNTCQQVEEWTYNPGYGQFMTMLLFEGGSLASIRYGDRVTTR